MFKGKSDAYIICFSVTDSYSFKEVEEIYMNLERSLGHDSNVIVFIGNQSDLEDERQVSFDEGKEMAMRLQNGSYIETSALKTIKIIEAFQTVIRDFQNADNTLEEDFDDSNSTDDSKPEKKKFYCNIM